ncbi:MAG: hypothetical protein ACOC0P_07005, partial [Planctomycetota bacterium]
MLLMMSGSLSTTIAAASATVDDACAEKAACLDPMSGCFTEPDDLAQFASFSVAPVEDAAEAVAAALGLGAVERHEFRLNGFTGNQQSNVSIDFSPTRGEGFAVWGSRRQEFGSFGVFGQRFDAAGRKLGPELQINDFMPGQQSDPAVAWVNDETAWVAWESINQDGDRGGIYLRRFAHNSGEG